MPRSNLFPNVNAIFAVEDGGANTHPSLSSALYVAHLMLAKTMRQTAYSRSAHVHDVFGVSVNAKSAEQYRARLGRAGQACAMKQFLVVEGYSRDSDGVKRGRGQMLLPSTSATVAVTALGSRFHTPYHKNGYHI